MQTHEHRDETAPGPSPQTPANTTGWGNAARRLAGVLVLLATLCAAGCVEFEQTLVIRRDGSATMVLNYSFDEALFATLSNGQRTITDWQESEPSAMRRNPAWMLSEEQARAYLRDSGVTVQSYSANVQKGRRVIRVECTVTDVRTALASGKFGDLVLTQNEHGDYVLRVELPEPAEHAVDPARSEQMKALCRGLHLALTVQTPTPITSAMGFAVNVKGNLATWAMDADKDETFLKTPPRLELTFAGKELNWSKK